MNALSEIRNLPKETLIKIIEMLGKNWLTVDGLWFQTAYFNPAFEFEFQEISANTVIQTCISCPNQEVRLRQGQNIFPCKKVGIDFIVVMNDFLYPGAVSMEKRFVWILSFKKYHPRLVFHCFRLILGCET